MANESTHELEALAALYALGHLHGQERTAFEALLHDPQNPAAATLKQFQQVIVALSCSTPAAPPRELRTRLLAGAHQDRRPSTAGQITLAPGLLLVLAEQLTWRETRVPGVRYKSLFVDSQRRYASSLVTMAAGTIWPRHRHTQIEELFMLSGDVVIGGHRLQPGDYCRAAEGSVHEAFHTETGCTFVALASIDDEYLAAETAPVETPPPPVSPISAPPQGDRQ